MICRRRCSIATCRRPRRSAVWPSAARAAPPAARRSGLLPDLTQEDHLEGLPIGTRGGAVDRLHLPDGWRVRNPGSPDARSRRARRGSDRAARRRVASRQGARAGVHGEAPAARARARDRRSAPQDSCAGDSRTARARRCVSQEVVDAASRRRASPTRRTSTTTGIRESSRRSIRFRSSGRMARSRPATRRAAAASSSRALRRRSRTSEPPGRSCRRS